jgi:hypothetical protein
MYLKRFIRKHIGAILMAFMCFNAFIYGTSIMVAKNIEIIPDEISEYATKWAPLFYSSEILSLSILALIVAIGYNSCVLTKTASWLYASLYVVSIIYILVPINYWGHVYILNSMLVSGIIILGLLFAIRLCLKKFLSGLGR